MLPQPRKAFLPNSEALCSFYTQKQCDPVCKAPLNLFAPGLSCPQPSQAWLHAAGSIARAATTPQQHWVFPSMHSKWMFLFFFLKGPTWRCCGCVQLFFIGHLAGSVLHAVAYRMRSNVKELTDESPRDVNLTYTNYFMFLEVWEGLQRMSGAVGHCIR